MEGLLLIVFGLLIFIVGLVFLFFNNLRKIGLGILLVSIIAFAFGVRSCSKSTPSLNLGFGYPSQEDLMEQEIAEEAAQESWQDTVSNSSKEQADQILIREIKRLKKDLGIDTRPFWENSEISKARADFFEKQLLLAIHSKQRSRFPFAAFDFERLYRMKRQIGWKSSMTVSFPIGKKIIHVSGILYNDSSYIAYGGFVNSMSREIYWTQFKAGELLIKDKNVYENYGQNQLNPYLELEQSSLEKRVELLQYRSMYSSVLFLNQIMSKSRLEEDQVVFQGKATPMYQISELKANGGLILRLKYKF